MKEKKVISRQNMPTRIPLVSALVVYLALEHFNSPEWLYGALGVLFLAAFISSFVRLWRESQVDLFGEKENK